MQYLLRYKIVYILVIGLIHSSNAFSQGEKVINQPDHDNQRFHMGISLGANRAYYHFDHDNRFLQFDSVLAVESIQNTGVHLAWLVNMNLSEHFDLRTYPIYLIFTEKAFEYKLKYPDPFGKEEPTTIRKVQGITLMFPLQIKFSSDRINNYKVYTIAGGKVEYDFAASKGEKNAEKLIKLNKLDYGFEAGIGFHFYLPFTVISPELKVGWGLKNVHSRDPNLKFSNVIDKINSRTITLSLIVE